MVSCACTNINIHGNDDYRNKCVYLYDLWKTWIVLWKYKRLGFYFNKKSPRVYTGVDKWIIYRVLSLSLLLVVFL